MADNADCFNDEIGKRVLSAFHDLTDKLQLSDLRGNLTEQCGGSVYNISIHYMLYYYNCVYFKQFFG